MGVSDYLAEQRIPFETLLHPPAYSAQRRAKYLGIPGKQVAKSVLLKGPAGYFLAILPATLHIDPEKLAVELGGPVRLANAEEMAKVFTDCEWGVASPLGSRYGVPTYLEESVCADAIIVLELNYRHEAIRMRCGDFEQLEKPRRLRFACR